MLSPVKILRKTIVNALINRKTTINCEVLRKVSVPCSIDMEHIIPPPAFVSAEVGLIDAYTIDILFDRALNESKIPDNIDFIVNTSNPNALYDMDENVYTEVTIGTQIWLVENLKTTKYADGSTIPLITDNTEWTNDITGGMCYYNNDVANKAIYGSLYNWYAVDNVKGLAYITKNGVDQNYRVPTYADFTTLATYLGGGAVAGGKLKETGIIHWQTPNTGADNSSGFTSLPGGARVSDFSAINQWNYLWTTDESTPATIKIAYTKYNIADLMLNASFYKYYGASIRLVKDV